MNYPSTYSKLLFVTLLLCLSETALASTTWYVDGVHGSNGNNCKSPASACKTIGHAISLAASGDSIMVAAATYSENLTISKTLKIIGSGASTPILDGGGAATVVTTTATTVVLSRLTIRNGRAPQGGGVSNSGTLMITGSTISGNRSFTFNGGGGIYNGGRLAIYNSTVSETLRPGRAPRTV
jgi:nitrous oxidase accessory protein NosD